VASGEAIARQVQEAILNGKSSKIRELCGEDSALITANGACRVLSNDLWQRLALPI
jgi:hypothetical protein